MSEISPRTCRAGRALVGMSQEDLAQRATLSVSTLKNYEAGRSTPTRNNIQAIKNVLVAEGVKFIAADAKDGEGVRLRGAAG